VSHCAAFNQETIREVIAEAILKAEDKKKKAIAVSDMGCKNSDFPLTGLAKIIIQEAMKHARSFESPSLQKVIVCSDNKETHQVFDDTIRGYVRHMIDDLGFGPYVTVDIIIEVKGGIILIERSNPPYGWAIPGGFLDYGESLEETAVREAKEETNMDLEKLSQFHNEGD